MSGWYPQLMEEASMQSALLQSILLAEDGRQDMSSLLLGSVFRNDQYHLGGQNMTKGREKAAM